MMQDIGSLLQKINQQKDVVDSVIKEIGDITGVFLDKKDISFYTYRDNTYIKIQTSGAKKTLLSFKKGELQKGLIKLGFILQ